MSILRALSFSLAAIFLLAGCDQVNDLLNKQKDIGKAVGAACRHGGRSLEDCYNRNSRVSQTDIYAGWKEMNEYMQAKKLDIVPPPTDVPTPTAAPAPVHAETDASAAAEKPKEKTTEKAPAKH